MKNIEKNTSRTSHLLRKNTLLASSLLFALACLPNLNERPASEGCEMGGLTGCVDVPPAYPRDVDPDVDMYDMASDMMDAGSDMNDMASDMMDAGSDMNDMAPDMLDAGNDMTPDMNPCSTDMYDSTNQLLGILNESKQSALGATRYIGAGYGNYTFTCNGSVSELFEGTVLDNAGMQVKVVEIKTAECNAYYEFGPGNLGTRAINQGWQSVVTPTTLEVLEHGFYPNTQTNIPNQQAITLTMTYDRNTQEIDGQPLCPELVNDIENQL